jgi:hypothetical protein
MFCGYLVRLVHPFVSWLSMKRLLLPVFDQFDMGRSAYCGETTETVTE